MIYFVAPAIIVFIVGLVCLDVKIGFWVADRTEHTGFDTGFYMLTVIGLMAAQVSAAAWMLS